MRWALGGSPTTSEGARPTCDPRVSGQRVSTQPSTLRSRVSRPLVGETERRAPARTQSVAELLSDRSSIFDSRGSTRRNSYTVHDILRPDSALSARAVSGHSGCSLAARSRHTRPTTDTRSRTTAAAPSSHCNTIHTTPKSKIRRGECILDRGPCIHMLIHALRGFMHLFMR